MKVIDGVMEALSEHGNLILGIVGVAGLFTSSVMVYLTRPKVDAILEERQEKIEEIQNSDELSDVEKEVAIKKAKKENNIKLVKTVAPTVAVIGLTATCQIAGIVQSENKIKDATATALVGCSAYDKLYDKTKAIVGKDKAEKIENEALKESLEEKYPQGIPAKCFEQGRGGTTPFLDKATGKLYYSDETTILQECQSTSNRITSGKEPYISLNEFYTDLDLEEVTVGNYVGFDSAHLPNPDFSQTIKIGDTPVVVIRWKNGFYSIKNADRK